MAKPEAEDDQDETIENLKRRAEELSGGQMKMGVLDDCPAQLEETFWKQVVAWEEAPWATHFQQLETAGVSLPPPDSLDDQKLNEKLWEVIHALALLRIFVEETDHLSDRELYSQLWIDSLREETKTLPPAANSATHLPMIGSGSEEDNQLYLKYYADDDSRRHWQEDFPEDALPAHEDLPYDRDRLLPKPDYRSPANWEPN